MKDSRDPDGLIGSWAENGRQAEKQRRLENRRTRSLSLTPAQVQAQYGDGDPFPGLDEEIAQEVQAGRQDEDADVLPAVLPVGEMPAPKPVQWDFQNLITAFDPALIVGDDEAGKTTIAVALATGGIVGAPAFGHPDFAAEPGPSLIISEEDPPDVLINHAQAIARGHGWDWDTIQRNLYILALEGVNLDSERWRGHILMEVQRVQARRLFLDPYTDLTSAKENDNDGSRITKRFLRDVGKLGCTPYVIHHLGKPDSQGTRSLKDRIRGASALKAAGRSILAAVRSAQGIEVHPLKLSRALKADPFVVDLQVEAEPDNPGVWISATMQYVTSQDAAANVADDFVKGRLAQYGTLSSTEIKELAQQVDGLSAVEVSAAIKRLSILKVIDFEKGPRNRKDWRLLSLPEEGGQGRQGSLPSLPKAAGQAREGTGEVAPLYEEGNPGKVPAETGQTDGFTCVNDDCEEQVGGPNVTCINCKLGEVS